MAIELKSTKREQADPLQTHNLQKIEKARGFSFVIYPENWDESYRYLKHLSTGG